MQFHSDTSKWQKTRKKFFLKYFEIALLFIICYLFLYPILKLKRKKKPNKERKDILVYGAYGNLSIGDDAILLSIKNYFQQNFPQYNLIVSSYRPEDTEKQFNLPCILQGRTLEGLIIMYKNRKKFDTVIFGGGGIIETHNYKIKSILGTLQKTSKFFLGAILNKDVVFLGIGTNTTEYPGYIRILLKEVFRHAQSINTRDEGSYNAIKRINPHVEVNNCTDPALLLGEQYAAGGESASKVDAIAVNIMPFYTLVNDKNVMVSQRHKLSAFLDEIIEKFDKEIHFFPMVLSSDPNEQAAMLSLMKNKHRVKEFSPTLTPYEFMNTLSRYPLLIGTRLHANILSFNANVPVLGLAYHTKIDNLFNVFNDKDFISFPLLTFDTNEVIKTIRKILDNNDEIKQRISEIKGRVIPLAKANFMFFKN
jgi:polysaccharide pyruvyl transferase WcaK-like protein